MDSGGTSSPRDRARQLMMAAVDDEITPEERDELEAALAGDAALRDEWDAFMRLREVTGGMTVRRPPPEIWESYWEGVYRRFERGLGWVLASVGAIVIATWGTWEWVSQLMADVETPILVRWSVLAMCAGLVILFVSVVRERWFMSRSDPYRDVLR
ncbi:MAG: zf-HC2 domain-containing protein [Gemmatimonadota bacterium]|nr:zf-HC2 domain-containing protein [Gemmatimonadota bacterium]